MDKMKMKKMKELYLKKYFLNRGGGGKRARDDREDTIMTNVKQTKQQKSSDAKMLDSRSNPVRQAVLATLKKKTQLEKEVKEKKNKKSKDKKAKLSIEEMKLNDLNAKISKSKGYVKYLNKKIIELNNQTQDLIIKIKNEEDKQSKLNEELNEIKLSLSRFDFSSLANALPSF